jgi:hypothetical protein
MQVKEQSDNIDNNNNNINNNKIEKTHVLAIDCRIDPESKRCFWIAAVVYPKDGDKVKGNFTFNGILDWDKTPMEDSIFGEKIVPYAKRCLELDKTDRRFPNRFCTYKEMLTHLYCFFLKHCSYCDVITDYSSYGIEKLFGECDSLYEPIGAASIHPEPLFDISKMLTERGFYANTSREAFISEHACSLIPADWTEKCFDPLYGAFATLSIYLVLAQPRKKATQQ